MDCENWKDSDKYLNFADHLVEPWFEMNEKPPIAFIKVEIIEGANMKPADMNGQFYIVVLF